MASLNLATLTPALHPFNRKRGNAKLTMAAVLGVTLLDLYPASSLSMRQRRSVTHRPYRARSGFPNGVASARRAARNGKVQRLQSNPLRNLLQLQREKLANRQGRFVRMLN